MLEEVRHQYETSSFRPSERPAHKFECTCDMCQQYEERLVGSYLRENHRRLRLKIEERLTQPFLNTADEYMWLLKKLQLPSNKIVLRGVDFFISEICFYKDGEAASLFLNRDFSDNTLKEIQKERLTNIFIRKTFNERRRKYREKLAQITRDSHNETMKKKPMGFVEKKKEGLKVDPKDAVIIRFNEGYEQLLNQTDFLSIMDKRKKDSFFGTITFIRNFLPIKDDAINNVIIKFEAGKLQYPELYERAKLMMRIYGSNVLPQDQDYIPEDMEKLFCEQLQQHDLKRLFSYIVYKMVAFVECFQDTRILRGHFHWKVDQFKRPVLFNAYKLQYREDPRFDWTNEVAEQRNRQLEHQTFYRKQLPELEETARNISYRMEAIMDDHYQSAKEHYGLSMKLPENTEQAQNNHFYRKLHPQCKVDLSIGLSTTTTLDEFKKVHLGFVPKKKPLVSDFKAGMLQTLHQLTSRRKGSYTPWQPDTAWNDCRSPLTVKRTTRPSSTRTSLKHTIDKLDELNRSVNCYDV